MDDDPASGDAQDDTVVTNPATVPGGVFSTATTTPYMAHEADPPAWEIFLLFIFGAIILVLAGQWVVARWCKCEPPGPAAPPPHKPGKVLRNMAFGQGDMELNLLEDNDEDGEGVEIVVDRAAKIK